MHIPNDGDDNQSCRILTVLFNRINWLRVPYYNIYSGTLFYINVSISRLLRYRDLCVSNQFKAWHRKLVYIYTSINQKNIKCT